MIDVFLRWYPQSGLREHLANAVVERLKHFDNISLNLVGPSAGSPYHIASKRIAEQRASTEIYCVIDDDQLPIRDDFFKLGAETLANNPAYGMLAGFPMEYLFHGQPYARQVMWGSHEIVEAHAIGCPYFVKKGTLEFPEGPIGQYDGILSKVVTDKGLKTGLVPECLYNHLGFGFSQVEKCL